MRTTTRFRAVALLVPALSVLLAGCAGQMQVVRVTTAPQGATLMVNGEEQGTTPVSITLDKAVGKYEIRLEKEGFIPELHMVKKQFRNHFYMVMWWPWVPYLRDYDVCTFDDDVSIPLRPWPATLPASSPVAAPSEPAEPDANSPEEDTAPAPEPPEEEHSETGEGEGEGEGSEPEESAPESGHPSD